MTRSSSEKQAADQRRRQLQAADAPKAWQAYQAEIDRTRARTAELRALRLARDAAPPAAETVAPTPKKKSR